MPQDLSSLLRETIERELLHLRALPDDRASIHPNGPASWSPKQELGHLIDSAANNHIRFVRAALEPEFRGPAYAQNDWVAIHGYQNMQWLEIIDFWYRYNALLARVVESVPTASLDKNCIIGSGAPVTLGFVIGDYILHMQHHIDHLLGREIIAAYPAV